MWQRKKKSKMVRQERNKQRKSTNLVQKYTNCWFSKQHLDQWWNSSPGRRNCSDKYRKVDSYTLSGRLIFKEGCCQLTETQQQQLSREGENAFQTEPLPCNEEQSSRLQMLCGNLKEGRTKALWLIHLERCGVQGECATETGKIWCQPIIINLVDRIFQRWSRQYLPFHLLFQIFPFTCQKVESNSSLESRWAWDSLVTSRMWQRGHSVSSGTRSKTQLRSQQSHHAVATMLCGSPATWRGHMQPFQQPQSSSLWRQGPDLRVSESSDGLSPAIKSLSSQPSNLPS